MAGDLKIQSFHRLVPNKKTLPSKYFYSPSVALGIPAVTGGTGAAKFSVNGSNITSQ